MQNRGPRCIERPEGGRARSTVVSCGTAYLVTSRGFAGLRFHRLAGQGCRQRGCLLSPRGFPAYRVNASAGMPTRTQEITSTVANWHGIKTGNRAKYLGRLLRSAALCCALVCLPHTRGRVWLLVQRHARRYVKRGSRRYHSCTSLASLCLEFSREAREGSRGTSHVSAPEPRGASPSLPLRSLLVRAHAARLAVVRSS